MASKIGVFILTLLTAVHLAPEVRPECVVWNVGQGQWVTIIDGQGCWHLDMGGEFAPWRELIALCRGRPNRVSLSHWDSDHIGFLGRAKMWLPNLCLLNAPLGVSSERKMRALKTVPHCSEPSPFEQWADPSGKTANAKSWVVLWKGILAPGDSPRGEEKRWIHAFPDLAATRLLILGHHGSRTSTSKGLLDALTHVREAVSSARKSRYGHPHPEVVHALESRRIPLLRTEDWGNLHFQL